MALAYALLPGLVAADFADFVETAKEATKNTFAGSKPVETKVPVSIGHHLATFWDRNSPYDFIPEFFGILFIIGMVALYYWGSSRNETLAKEKFQAIYRQLHDNFAQVGLAPDSAPLAKDGPSEFISYATGRKNVKFAHITISAFPRHDMLVGYPLKTLYGMYFEQDSLVDRLTIDFTLPPAYDGFVFGVLNKNVMRHQRLSNWDLTFTKTNDAPFSNHFVIMTEIAEVTDKILGKDLIDLIVSMKDSLEYVVLSDQPKIQPKTGDAEKDLRTIRFSVLLGPSSADKDNLNQLLAQVLTIADNLPKQGGKVSANGLKRLTQSREEIYKAIAKHIAAEEAVDAPKRLTRKEIRDKEKKEAIGKLSAKEQKKALEKERERSMKKGQSKMARKA